MQEAMNELYRAYYEDLYRFVTQAGAGRGDADALVQEVLMAADRHLPQYRGECGYKAWLFAVAYLQLNSPWRKLLRGRKGQPTDAVAVSGEAAEALHDDLDEDERERLQLLQQLRYLFAELPRRERDVLVLLELHEFSVRDAGIIMAVMDEKVRAWTERALEKVRDRFPQPEQYQRALRLMREEPSELELRAKKAEAWEAFADGAQRGRRRAKLRPAIWGTVGVVVAAAGVLGWQQFDGGEAAQEATTAPAQLQPVQTTEPGGQAEMFGVTRVDLSRVFSPNEDSSQKTNVLLIENRIFQIEEPNGKRTQLLAMENSMDEFHLMDIQSPYVVFTLHTAKGEDRVYRVHLERKTIHEIPLENQHLTSLRVWPGAHGVAIMTVDDSSAQRVAVYDWDTGAETQVMEREYYVYNRLDALGDHLVLASEREIAVKTPDGELRPAVQVETPRLRYLRMTNDYLLYVEDAGGNPMQEREYQGTARIKKYDMRTGAVGELLPGMEGDQWLLNEYVGWWNGDEDQYGIFVGNFLPTETVDDGSGRPPVQKGVQQIWRVMPSGEGTMVYEEPVDWGHHGYQMMPRQENSDVFVIHHNHPELPPLAYNIKTGAVAPLQN